MAPGSGLALSILHAVDLARMRAVIIGAGIGGLAVWSNAVNALRKPGVEARVLDSASVTSALLCVAP
jgi:hypothetical protein